MTVEGLRSEFVAMCKQHVGVPRSAEENSGGLGTSLGGGSCEGSDTHLEVQPEHASESKTSHIPEVEKYLKLPLQHMFVQGLLLKWQKKVLLSASTFSYALHQARAAEQEQHQLSKMHPPPRQTLKSRVAADPKTLSAPPTVPPREDKLASRSKRDPSVLSVGQPHTSSVNAP